MPDLFHVVPMGDDAALDRAPPLHRPPRPALNVAAFVADVGVAAPRTGLPLDWVRQR